MILCRFSRLPHHLPISICRFIYPQVLILPVVCAAHYLSPNTHVGEITSMTFMAFIITPRRFPTSKAVAAYCGLDPSLKISVGKVTSTVKRGGHKSLHGASLKPALPTVPQKQRSRPRLGKTSQPLARRSKNTGS